MTILTPNNAGLIPGADPNRFEVKLDQTPGGWNVQIKAYLSTLLITQSPVMFSPTWDGAINHTHNLIEQLRAGWKE